MVEHGEVAGRHAREHGAALGLDDAEHGDGIEGRNADLAGAGLQAAERDHILRALREAKGIIGGPGGAAERLGLKRTTLNSKMKKLGIERGDYM